MKKIFFLSTAIDYPSEKPHLGHCLEKVQADVLARYKRLQGFDVYFSIGTDEHGLKIQRYAQRAEKEPQEFVNKMSGYFKVLWELLNISNDDFIRTTEKRHIKVVQKIIKKIYDKGDIYKGKYKGLYCVGCESYYLPKDLEGNLCLIHHKPVEIIEEETYFFRMSKYQKQISKHIQENKDFIIPESKRNEIFNRLKQPLQDLSISRKAVEWGIPFFLDKKFTTFVWAEALLNYISTLGYPSGKFKKFWPGEIHIGKDIIWHHGVILPCLLLSAGLKLPKSIFIHGFLTVNGRKMSKSLGNVVDPFELISKYGTDAVRYFLLREISPTEDGDFTYEKFEERYNADLAKGIGNLTARVLTLAQKGKIKPIKNKIFTSEIAKVKKDSTKAISEFKFNEALEKIWRLVTLGDKYIDVQKPWALESDSKKFEEIIGNLLFLISEIGELLVPFIPETADKIAKHIAKSKSVSLFPRLK